MNDHPMPWWQCMMTTEILQIDHISEYGHMRNKASALIIFELS